jgi:aminocarboxymuconate-semialdehyde decarboxylase
MGLVVDIHAHAVVPDAQLLVRRERAALGGTGASVDPDLPASAWQHGLVDLDTRLTAMDDAGIDVQAVSAVSWQFHYWAGRSLAAELVDTINARLAALARQAPDRLVGVATVALQHPDLAAEQLRRAVDDYDFRGVQIATSPGGGRTLSHHALDPFWSMAELLGIPVLVHQRECGGQTRSPVDLVDPALELVRVLSDLVSGGVMDRFPALAVCATPAGGSFPHPVDLAGRAIDRPHDEHVACHDLATGLHLYLDTLVGDEASLDHLVDCLGADHVLMGTGYPFASAVGQTLTSLDSLPREQRDRMSGGNALGLLRLRAPDRS